LRASADRHSLLHQCQSCCASFRLFRSGCIQMGKTKTPAILLTLAVSILSVAAPVFFAIWMARSLSLEAETNRTLLYAQDIVKRSDTTVRQIQAGIDKLVQLAQQQGDPCSEAMLQMMRQIDLSSSYIQSMGHVEGTTLACSSLGTHPAPGIELGPADFVTGNGTLVRRDFSFAFTPNESFILVESMGFVAILHRDLPVDTTTQEPDALLAIYLLNDEEVLTSRGTIPQAWLDRLMENTATTFEDRGYIVSTVKSEQALIGGVAAIPLSYLSLRTWQFAWLLVPIGLLAGAVLGFTVLRLARIQLALPAVIKTALKRHEFFLLYQPIIDLQRGGIVGAEALIRWRRPGGELVRPDLFIPVAEDSGLIRQITARVLQLFAEEAGDLFKRYPDLHISINLSAADLQAADTVDLLENMARKTGAASGNVFLEATERSFIDHAQANLTLGSLRRIGMRVAIDDFGTGYSSLSSLEKLDIDLLKIDKSFVETLGTDAPTSQVVYHIIEMSKGLGLEMIAEGVETQAQADYLRAKGVHYAQGWLFGRPQPLSDILAALRAKREQPQTA